MNAEILLQNGFTLKQIGKSGIIGYIDYNEIGRINELLNHYGLKPMTSFDLIDARLYTFTYDELKRRLDILKENHILDVCYGSIENLIYNTDLLVARINACKKNNIPIKDENGYCEYLFNTTMFKSLGIELESKKEEVIEESEINEEHNVINDINPNLISALENNNEQFTGFNEDTFFKYQELCESIKHLQEEMPFIDYDLAVSNLALLLREPKNVSDMELLSTAILYNSTYNDNEINSIRTALSNIRTVNESGLSM